MKTPALRLYLSAPMTGVPEYNHPLLNAEAARLRAAGYAVENPAEITPAQTTWAGWMRRAIAKMLTCDTIVLMPGWHKSKGCTVEWLLASVLGMTILYHSPPPRAHHTLYKLILRIMANSHKGALMWRGVTRDEADTIWHDHSDEDGHIDADGMLTAAKDIEELLIRKNHLPVHFG